MAKLPLIAVLTASAVLVLSATAALANVAPKSEHPCYDIADCRTQAKATPLDAAVVGIKVAFSFEWALESSGAESDNALSMTYRRAYRCRTVSEADAVGNQLPPDRARSRHICSGSRTQQEQATDVTLGDERLR